jgi:putative toxin-antitoxin system antitoxin component (TIGR02293 family)
MIMGVSMGKRATAKSRPSGGKQLGSARRVTAHTRRHTSGPRSSRHGAGTSVEAPPVGVAARKAGHVSPNVIRYTPEKGVIFFAKRVARATPMEAVEIERKGVSSRYLKDLAKHLGLAKTRVFGIIAMPRATAAKKAAKGEQVTGHSGQAVLALTKLLALANEIAAESSDPDAKDFDAAKWLGTWIERAQPALGGRKPADLLDTPTGADVVTRLLGSVASGAYQ